MPSFPESLLPSEQDLLYEEEILRNPFHIKAWLRYLDARKDAPVKKRFLIFERALKALPGSYKLWHAYLIERRTSVRGLSLAHPSWEALNNTFERALVTMHKMPRIWLDFLQHLLDQKLLTRTRRVFDRSLQSLPPTQHDRIWELYLQFSKQDEVPVETALRVYRRFLKFDPSQVEEYIDFLIQSHLWQEAADNLANILNDESFASVKGKTKHQLWLELCDLLTKHAEDISGIKVEAIIRGGLGRFKDEVGRLWTSLADYFIRRGLFENARDVYEEGLTSVLTVRDFSMIFDAYTQFEESMLAAKIELLEKVEEKAQKGSETLLSEQDDLDLRMARLESLLERRGELVSSVLLRQNPHNVHEWLKRVKLFSEDPSRQILTLTEAVKTVDPHQAVGKVSALWARFAKLYEEHGDLGNARVVFEKAIQADFKSVDDLASVWCEWAEMELRAKNFKGARELLKRATQEPSAMTRRQATTEGPPRVQLQLYRSLKLWSFFVDLEESLGSLETVRPLYDRIITLKIATPQIIINYAFLLEENQYFEDAFRVYEKGVHAFKYPHVKDIWATYLNKFVTRYGGKKLERARDLFEQAISQAPESESLPLFLQYAKLEEQFGLANHAMAIYDRAAKTVPESQKKGVFELFIAKATEFYGLPRTRDIYERAIESGLPDGEVKAMCLQYASMERKLGEVDRARAIYIYTAQLADPNSDIGFWETWNAFEIAHGNEDTFREMLRIKRSVSASYSQMHFALPDHLLLTKAAAPQGVPIPPPGGDQMAALEKVVESSAATAPLIGGIPSSILSERKAPLFVSAGKEIVGQMDAGIKANPEEIELGEEDEDEEEEEERKVEVSEKQVPDSVYGALAEKARELKEKAPAEEEPLGALERIKRQRKQ